MRGDVAAYRVKADSDLHIIEHLEHQQGSGKNPKEPPISTALL
jgi:hypothetical protein